MDGQADRMSLKIILHLFYEGVQDFHTIFQINSVQMLGGVLYIQIQIWFFKIINIWKYM